jgi:hypothetical protein
MPVGAEPPLLMPPVLEVLRVVPVAPVLPAYCANAGEAASAATTATQARVRNVLMNHPFSFAARSGMLLRGHIFTTIIDARRGRVHTSLDEKVSSFRRWV